MNITIGSPDGLGDFVLRMPFVEALLAAGHQVQFVMRPLAADLARDLFPEAEVLVLEHEPFRAEAKKLRKPFRREIDAIRRFEPDMYVAGAFQLNFFDEVFLEERPPQIRVAGFEAKEDFWPSDTSVDPRELTRHFDVRARVASAMPEGEKNLRLAASALGVDRVEKIAARPPTAPSLAAARALFAEHGIREREFVVVCAGSRPGLVMKDWGESNWAEFLRLIGQHETRPLVFLGNPKESASIGRLRAALPRGAKHVSLAENPPPVPVSYALVSLASAYLGRDSGVMHMAAAADVPVLSVFSGAHWPRFLPEARRGIVLTRKVPCQGCNFFCPFPEPWCVTSVPPAVVADAWRRLASVSSLEVIELAPEDPWIGLCARTDASDFAREASAAARSNVARIKSKSLWHRLRGALMSV